LIAKEPCYFLCLEIRFVHFLLAQKTNQKKAPEMTTSAKTGACYTSLDGATVLSEVRTISGFALAPQLRIFSDILIVG
jgi:hypothetical protein